MNENASGSLPFESPEEENKRLMEENARLRRALIIHGIPIPPRPPTNPPPAKAVEAVPLESKEDRARKRIAVFRSLFRGRKDVYARRWESADGPVWIQTGGLKELASYSQEQPGGPEESRSEDTDVFPVDGHRS